MMLKYSSNVSDHEQDTRVVFYGNVQVVYLVHWTIHSAENAISVVIHSHYFVSRGV